MMKQWKNGLGGLGRLKRIFFYLDPKIRFNLPNPPNPFFHCIAFFKAEIADSSLHNLKIQLK
jgi:hypothetical protein